MCKHTGSEGAGAAAVATTMANKAVAARVNFIGQTKLKGMWFYSITKIQGSFLYLYVEVRYAIPASPVTYRPFHVLLLNFSNKHNYVLLNIPATYAKRQKRVDKRGFWPPTQQAS
jgi:hypothetical protein